MELLTNALWITLIAYVVFVLGRWLYTKFLKESSDPFFYIRSLKKDGDKGCLLSLEAPLDDFIIEIRILNGLETLYTKNAQLKLGINKVELAVDSSLFSSDYILQIKSDSQCIERKFKELSD
jgi:hypothetical protein